jgi:hypothetical protein
LTKSNLELKLDAIEGRAGSLKIGHNTPYHPKKPVQKYPPIPKIFIVDIIPLLLVSALPHLVGNNKNTHSVYLRIFSPHAFKLFDSSNAVRGETFTHTHNLKR